MRKRIIVQVLEDLIEFHDHLIAALKRERKAIDGGKVVLMHSKYIYEKTKSGKVGITKQKRRVRRLLRKEYLSRKIKELQSDKEFIEKMLEKLEPGYKVDTYMANRFEDTPFDYQQSLISEHQYQCNCQESQNPSHREDLTVKTNGGRYVRTFSEKVWGDLYESLNIPYCYEMKFTIDVTDMPTVKGAYCKDGRMYKDYYPDFVIPLADGTFYVHEHLGLIDKEDYIYKTGEKIIAYTNGMKIPMKRIVFTYPDDVKDQRRMIKFLQKNVVPYI